LLLIKNDNCRDAALMAYMWAMQDTNEDHYYEVASLLFHFATMGKFDGLQL
jgi:hypothetical protein